MLSIHSSNTYLTSAIVRAIQGLPSFLTKNNLDVRLWLQTQTLSPTLSPTPTPNPIAVGFVSGSSHAGIGITAVIVLTCLLYSLV
jgi:hypothetical protein